MAAILSRLNVLKCLNSIVHDGIKKSDLQQFYTICCIIHMLCMQGAC